MGPIELPTVACRWRTGMVRPGKYRCLNEKVLCGPGGVSMRTCSGCVYREPGDGSPHPAPRPRPKPDHTPGPVRSLPCIHEGPILEWCNTCSGAKAELRHVRECDLYDKCTRGVTGSSVRACATCGDYRTEEVAVPTQPPPRPLSWSYGVTTVLSRRNDLLPKTLASLGAGGFDKPRLFVDGCSLDEARGYEFRFGLPLTIRNPAVKAYQNWVLALAELYAREPMADRYAIFQDDLLTVTNLREYLDGISYPENGYWNLYTFPPPRQSSPPHSNYTGFYESNQYGKGGVALVFDRKAVQTLLTHPHIVERPTTADKRRDKALDGAVVSALNKAGYKEYVHYPSLTYHTGVVSAIGNQKQQQAVSFPGEDFDARDFLKK